MSGRRSKRRQNSSDGASGTVGETEEEDRGSGSECHRERASKLSEDEGAFVTWYINLKKREKRRAKMEARFAETEISGLRLEAKTGDDAPETVILYEWDTRLNAHFDTTTLPHPRVPLTKGERGCAMSHACLWSICAQRSDENVPMLILEDDVQLVPHFKLYLEAVLRQFHSFLSELTHPSQRRVILYLGADVAAFSPPYQSNQDKIWLRSLSHNLFSSSSSSSSSLTSTTSQDHALRIVSADYVWQTSSYLIWPPAARALLAALPMREPVDNFISRQLLERNLQAFVLLPNLCKQVNAYNDGDILHSRPALAVAPYTNTSDVPLAPLL